jgi:hypothetical protein
MTTYWKTSLSTLLMAALSSTATTAIEAPEPIPIMLVGTDDTTAYPDPICSKCRIVLTEDSDSASSTASVAITYPTDAPGFAGDIGVTVWLESEQRSTLWLDDVSLEPGDDVELVARAGSDWSWHEVRFVWLRFVPE